MARRRGKDDNDFVRLTGLWKPRNPKSKALGTGLMRKSDLEELLERIEDAGGDGAFLYLVKNRDAEGSRDPRFYVSAVAAPPQDEDDDDEDERPRRRKKKPAPKRRPKKRRDEEEEDEDFDEDDDDDVDPF